MKYFYFWMLTLFCSSLAFSQLSEDFESDVTANGWSLYSELGDDPGFVQTSARANSGSSSYYHDDANISGVSTSYLVSPQYTVQPGDAFSAYVNQNFSTLYYDYSGIVISTASGDPIANEADFVELFELGEGFAEDVWTRVNIDLADYVGQTVYFAFKYTGDYDHEYYVDDVFVGAFCEPATATTEVVPACETGQFNVNVNLTSLGSASSVIISDNAGNSVTASAAGTYALGPYSSGTTVNYTITDSDNSSCSATLSQAFGCPPANDECAGATLVSAFPFNEEGDATYATQVENLACGNDAMNDGLWYSFVAESAQYTISLTSHGWDSAIGIFTGSCDALSCVDIQDGVVANNAETFTFIGQAGVTYYINVGHYSATTNQPEGTFTLNITSEEIPCNGPTNLAVSAVTDLSADVSWTGHADNVSYDLIWGEAGFTPGATPNAPGIAGTTYTISGLTPETEYDLYIRGNCAPGYSTWIGPVTFTTLEPGAILPGTDCIHPITIGALPYTTQDTTANYGDDYDGGQGSNCGSTSQYYLNGDDVVYAYTPEEDTSIDITMTPTGTWSGIFVYEDCNDIGVACVAGAADAGSNPRVIEDLLVTGGQTYFILISTWASPQSVAYTLNITENTCIGGSYTLNPVGLCETNQFNVELVVTDMGTITSYEVADNQGGASQTITAPGTYTFGPYTSPSSVELILTANDENCNDTISVAYACPPTNDECADAIEAPVNADFTCTETVSGTIMGATASAQTDDVVGTPNNDVWFSFVATNAQHRISLTNVQNIGGATGTDMAFGVYDATNGCESLTLIDDSDPNVLNIVGLTVGTEYLVRVYSYGTSEPGVIFDLCIGTPPSSEYDIVCGTPLEMSYCYTSNEQFGWTFNSTTDEPVTITFTAGGLEDNFDVIQIYDGTGTDGVLLWDSYNANPNGTRFDLAGTSFNAASGSLHLSFDSDGSIACDVTADIATWEFNVDCGVDLPEVDWANLQHPASGAISAGEEFMVYGQVYAEGITEAEGQGEGIQAWVGYSTTDTDPATWENWIPATFNVQVGNNDEFMANLGAAPLTAGTYYYAYRYRLGNGLYYYGGFNGGAWDGSNNVSGVLTVSGPANDECEGAIEVPVNDDFSCELVVSGTTLGASASAQEDDVVGTPNNDVWFSFVATNVAHRVSLINLVNVGGGATGTDMAFGVYDSTGGCEALVLVDDSDPNVLNLNGLTVGTTYLIRVFNWSATIANVSFDVCIGTPPSAEHEIVCGTPLEMSYCYTSDELFGWTFNSSTNEAVTISFNAGSVEDGFDFIRLYDGTGPDGVLLWDSNNANPNGSIFELAGSTFTAASGSLYFAFDSDGSVSCVESTNVSTWEFTVDCGVDLPTVDWANLQHPASGAISAGEEFIVYGQVYEEGLTEAEGPGEGIQAWVGYSTTDTDPATWENWIPATFNVQVGNNDEYMANLGAAPLSAGTYYYAYRYRIGNGLYYYGGFNSGAWDGTTNVNGVLTVSGPVNDECEGAIEVPVNPDYACAEVVSGSTQGATASAQEDDVVGTPNNDVWFSFVAETTAHRVSLINVVNLGGGATGTDMAFGVYDATSGCEALVLVDDSDPNILNLQGLTVGTTYLIRVYNWSSTVANISFDVCVGTPPPPPANDDCMDAVELVVGSEFSSNPVTTYNDGATGYANMPDPGCASYQGGEVWFTVTVPASGNVTVESNPIENGGVTDTGLAVYSGTCDTLTLIECDDDDSDSGLFSMVSLTGLTPGDILYVAVWEYGNNATGSFQVSAYSDGVVDGPANDDCVGAETLIVGETFEDNSTTGTTANATASAVADPSCGTYTGGDVWYAVTVPESGNITVETQSAGDGVTETGIAAYSGTCDTALVEVLCDAGGFAMLSADGLTPGDVYYIRVWSNTEASGSFLISAYSSDMSVNDLNGIANVKMYPNPTSDVLHISGADVKDVQVFSVSGQLTKTSVSGNTVNVRNLPTGTYVIRIIDMEGNVIQKKFIKK